MQKTVTTNVLTEKRVENKGYAPQYYEEGSHEAIIPKDLYMMVQAEIERRAHLETGTGKRRVYSGKYALSSIVVCAHCGDLFQRTHWTIKVDDAMYDNLLTATTSKGFDEVLTKLANEQMNSNEIERELDTAIKAQRQAMSLQRKLESEMDKLDFSDKHYDRKYESLSRRLDDSFDALENAERSISDCEARLQSIRNKDLSKKSVYESLMIFKDFFGKMDDHEKRTFVRSFIESIELYPDRQRKKGNPIKCVHFKFPVAYNGESVYSLSPGEVTDETVVLMTKHSE